MWENEDFNNYLLHREGQPKRHSGDSTVAVSNLLRHVVLPILTFVDRVIIGLSKWWEELLTRISFGYEKIISSVFIYLLSVLSHFHRSQHIFCVNSMSLYGILHS